MILNTLVYLAGFSRLRYTSAVRAPSLPKITELPRIVKLWHSRSSQRRRLADLDDHLLRDIGITRAQMEEETLKWFWRP